MYHNCEIFIPKLYGVRRTPVEPKVLIKYIQIFNVQFGGATPMGETGIQSDDGESLFPGQWKNPKTGAVEEDVCWLFRIYVRPEQIETFKNIAFEIGKELEQQEMLIDIGPPTGQFLKIADGVDTENEIEPPTEKDGDEDRNDGKNEATA